MPIFLNTLQATERKDALYSKFFAQLGLTEQGTFTETLTLPDVMYQIIKPPERTIAEEDSTLSFELETTAQQTNITDLG